MICSILVDGPADLRPVRAAASIRMDARAATHLPCGASRKRQRRARRAGGGHVAVERTSPAPPARRHALRSRLGSYARAPRPPDGRSLRIRCRAVARPAARLMRVGCRAAAMVSQSRRHAGAVVPRRCGAGGAARSPSRRFAVEWRSKGRGSLNFRNIRRRAWRPCPVTAGAPGTKRRRPEWFGA